MRLKYPHYLVSTNDYWVYVPTGDTHIPLTVTEWHLPVPPNARIHYTPPPVYPNQKVYLIRYNKFDTVMGISWSPAAQDYLIVCRTRAVPPSGVAPICD